MENVVVNIDVIEKSNMKTGLYTSITVKFGGFKHITP